jgi:hypothetical protein
LFIESKNMFRKIILFSSLVILLFNSCRSNKDRVEIPFMTYIEIPAGLNGFLTYHFPARVATLGQIPNNLLEARPARMRAFLETGEGNWNFVRRAYMDAMTDNGRVEMGYNLDVLLNSSSSLDLYPSIANLKDHIDRDSFDIEFKIDLRSNTTLTSRVRIEFTLQATLDQ